jgi:hypothetical protein
MILKYKNLAFPIKTNPLRREDGKRRVAICLPYVQEKYANDLFI